MNVNSVAVGPRPVVPAPRPDTSAVAHLQRSEAVARDEAPAAIAPSPAPDPADGPKKGVLRLLEEGHFRGVADVRLRLNFHDELGGVEASTVRAAVEDDARTLIDSFAQRLDAAPETIALDGESAASLDALRVELDGQLASALDGYRESGSVSTEALVEELRGAFDSFLDRLADLFADDGEPTDPNGTDGADDVSGGAAASSTVDGEPTDPNGLADAGSSAGRVGELRAFVEEALASLATRPDDVRLLPELSAPRGNGVAYDRFVSQYQDLVAATTDTARLTYFA